jgi:hypothetical protein
MLSKYGMAPVAGQKQNFRCGNKNFCCANCLKILFAARLSSNPEAFLILFGMAIATLLARHYRLIYSIFSEQISMASRM